MTVVELARRAGLPAHVVRYYARIGLLHPDRDPGNGYQLFRQGDVSRLKFIHLAKRLGYTLSEIGQILHDAEEGRSPCPRARDILNRRIRQIRGELTELVALQRRMEAAVEKWSTMSDGLPTGDSVCHLIESTAKP